MEAYRSKCPDCKANYNWVGFKTGYGKTERQLEQMKKNKTVCKECGSINLETGLDHGSEFGKEQDASVNFLVSLLG